MRTVFLTAVLAFVLLAAMSPCHGQTVAVIDVREVILVDAQFSKSIDALRAEIRLADNEFRAKQDTLRHLVKQSMSLEPGSPEARQLADEINTRQDALQADLEVRRAEYELREAPIYLEAYQRMMRTIRAYCTENEIGMVLRSDSFPLEDDGFCGARVFDPFVVYTNPDWDITKKIRARMNDLQQDP